MNKKIILLVVAALIPTFYQLLTTGLQNYWVGLILRAASLILVPVFSVMYIKKLSIKDSFKVPLMFKKSKYFRRLTIIGCVGSLLFIAGATLILLNLIDFNAIRLSLTDNYGITKLTYPFVALSIVLINPFIEEYFWRGFVFRSFYENLTFKNGKMIAYLTGILFSLHHTIIINGWFNWWQWLIVTIFLAFVGIGFNWLYNRTGNIYSGWIIHAFADLLIVTIGFIFVF